MLEEEDLETVWRLPLKTPDASTVPGPHRCFDSSPKPRKRMAQVSGRKPTTRKERTKQVPQRKTKAVKTGAVVKKTIAKKAAKKTTVKK